MSNPIAESGGSITTSTRVGCGREWRFKFIALTIGYYLSFALFPEMFRFLGVHHFWGWFLDSHAIVAANDAAAAGLDVHSSNPFDVMGRPHVYSRLWLRLSELGITREHNFLLGGVFVSGFLISSMLWLAPRSAGETVWYFAIIASGSIVLGVERANNDLFIFLLLMPVILMMSSRREWVRSLAIAPVMVATALKFYPAVAAIMVIAGRKRGWIMVRVIVAGALLLAFLYHEHQDLLSVSGVVPAPVGIISFGADQLFTGFGLGGRFSVFVAFVVACAIILVCRPWRWFGRCDVSVRYPREWLGFVLGSALLTGCYFAGSSYVYRLIFCIMLGPFLWRCARDSNVPRRVVHLVRVTAGLMLFMLWADTSVLAGFLLLAVNGGEVEIMNFMDVYVICKQPLVLGFFVCLLCFLAKFIKDSVMVFFPRLSFGVLPIKAPKETV